MHGFTDEAITFALALERHVDLRLEISEMWRCRDTVLCPLADPHQTDPDPCPDPDPAPNPAPGPDPSPDQVLGSLPVSTRDAIERLARRRGGREGAILLIHRDPGRFEHFATLGELS